MKVRFTHMTGSMRGGVEEFSLPLIRVGRALSSDLLLQDDEGLHRLASRMHAEFRLEGDKFVLYDLGSRNGTFVNGEAVQRRVLLEGDQVSFGLNGISFQVTFVATPDEEVDFLRATPLFKDLSFDLLQRIYRRGQIESYTAGSVLFKQGESSNILYVVRNGIIQLYSPKDDDPARIVTHYIGPGQTLGETTALLGEEHASEARIPEGAEIFLLTADRLRELLRASPELAEHLVITFARYLSRSYKQLFSQTKSKLQGSLFYFDLATVIQTLASSRESGLLTIYSLGRGLVRSMAWSSSIGAYPLGQIYMENGDVRYAWAGAVMGEDAFFQLFQVELNGSFSFEQGKKLEGSPGELITRHSVNLVIEAARLQDELNNLREKFPDVTVAFQLNASQLKVRDAKNMPIAEKIHEMLSERGGVTLLELLDALPCCYYVTYSVINELVDNNQLTMMP